MLIPPSGQLILQVAEKQRKERIDVYIVNHLPAITRSRVKQLIEMGLVTIDSVPVKPSHQVSPGEEINIKLEPRPQESYEPENIPLDIIYEDDHLMVINKPAGLVVHPAQGNWSGTMVNAILHHNQELLDKGAEFRAGIVHRLDKETSGLMVAAKNEFTLGELGIQFSEHSIERTYTALVWGHFKPGHSEFLLDHSSYQDTPPKKKSTVKDIPAEKTGTIIGALGRHPKDRKLIAVVPEGKPAVTHFRVIREFELHSHVEINLETGRTHQIRVHFSTIGHAVLGDPVYGGRNARFGNLTASQRIACAEYLSLIDRQALHAKTLGFTHPVTGETLRFESNPPDDFKMVLDIIH